MIESPRGLEFPPGQYTNVPCALLGFQAKQGVLRCVVAFVPLLDAATMARRGEPLRRH